MDTNEYFAEIDKKVRIVYDVAEAARKKGFDPRDKVEIPLARSMAEKVVALISTLYPQLIGCGVDKRILELEKEYGKLDTTVAFKIAEEVAKQKFCKFASLLEAMNAGARIGFAYVTLGVVSSPIEGLTDLKIGKTRNDKEYIIAYFSGPIRSAGTTATCTGLMIIDYLRELFGYEKYDPTEEEIKRYVIENYDYHERITNLQYLPTVEEIEFLAKNLPIQIAGEPTEKREVSNYKNLARVDTNFIRGGMCLTFSEGLAQKAAKGLRLLNSAKKNGIKSTGWDFLAEYIEIHKKRDKGKTDSSPTYIQDLVAGRPVFGHPSRSGSFRFRYGRARGTGFSAVAIHPATMEITDRFIAIGTQLKTEKPIKGCAISSCDTIEPPIVKLFNGSVKKINTREQAKILYPDVEEIIYLGDILFCFGDVLNRNQDLIKSGYVEEWWKLELEEKGGCLAPMEGVPSNEGNVSFEKAVELSEKFEIPFYPKFIYYWTQISNEQFLGLIDWLKNSEIKSGKIIFPYYQSVQEKFALGKRALELLGVEHEATIEHVVLNKTDTKSLLLNLGIEIDINDKDILFKDFIDKEKYNLLGKGVLEIINSFSKFIIKDKAGDFIGSRMGRPEKAKLRKLTGSPHVLFPVGKEGGRLRSVQAACETGVVKSTFPLYYCEKCKKETIYFICEECGSKCEKMYYCPECKQKFFKKVCPEHGKGLSYCSRNLDINYHFKKAVDKLGLVKEEIPLLIKGVRGTSSANHAMEDLAKGMLRALFNLQVNKDGTIRYDATELPLTHFKPKEIFVSVEKLKEIGYTKDIYKKDLENDEQILELKPHDIVIPCSPESLDERADDIFIKIANFIDLLLVKFYRLKPYYNVRKREDLIGKLGVCMAPHNCAGVVCRIIGFSNTQGLLASPYMHAAIRRDCFDYDTYIPIKKEGNWKIVKIGEMVESLNPCNIVDNFGTKEKKVNNFETIGFDKNLREFKINNFTKHTKISMLEIKTKLGKKIKVTENHKFFIEKGVKRASDLLIGDKLQLPIKINISERDIKQINLLELLKDEDLMVRKIKRVVDKITEKQKNNLLNKLNISKKQFMNYQLRDSYPANFVLELDDKTKKKIFFTGKIAAKRDNIEVPILIELGDELLEIIGLYVAEGFSRSIKGEKGLNQVYISASEQKIREFIKKTMKKSFKLIPTEKKQDRVTFSSKILYLFFSKILESGKNAREKRIPYLFLNLPLKRLACVLRGYFEGDGSADKKGRRVSCDSVSGGLLYDLEFCLARFGIFAKRYEYKKEPGPKVREFYIRKNRKIPKFKITKLIIGSDFIDNFYKIGFLSEKKNKILRNCKRIKNRGMNIKKDENFVYDSIISIKKLGKKESYCLNIDSENHFVMANSILTKNCDGDEMAVMLLLDVLLNFSREFLPGHRGGTQDAPLVLNARIDAGEVDDQILDFELVSEYPLELYRLSEQRKHSSEVKITTVKTRLKENKDPFVNINFTHDTTDFNKGVLCSSYKKLGTMAEKVQHQMELVEKLRGVDTSDVARLIIERHFIRDTRGNLRKFSMQQFRCVSCNEIIRRPPLTGVCPKCSGKIIFTIHEGGIKKYMGLATELVNKYNLSPYLKQSLELTQRYIDSVFGRELEKQEALEKWF